MPSGPFAEDEQKKQLEGQERLEEEKKKLEVEKKRLEDEQTKQLEELWHSNARRKEFCMGMSLATTMVFGVQGPVVLWLRNAHWWPG